MNESQMKARIADLESQLAAVRQEKERDSHFFIAGWNARNEGLDPTAQFKRAAIAAKAKQGE